MQELITLREQVDLTIDEQVRLAQAHVSAIEAQMQKTAAEINPNRRWQEVLQEVNDIKVEDGEQLRTLVEQKLKAAQAFVQARRLSDIPLDTERLMVIQATKTMGEGNLAHYIQGLDIVGVQQKDGANSLYQIPVITVHEGSPGHWLATHSEKPAAFTKLEPLIPVSRCFIEGWGAYAQKLMLEQGFMSDPKERLMALALIRTQAKYALTVAQLLAGPASIQQVAEELRSKGATPEQVKTGIKNLQERPFLFSSYFLGMAQILQLREQVKAKEGRNFSLQKFHDRLLSAGPYPIPTLASLLFNVELKPLTAMSQAEINRLYN